MTTKHRSSLPWLRQLQEGAPDASKDAPTLEATIAGALTPELLEGPAKDGLRALIVSAGPIGRAAAAEALAELDQQERAQSAPRVDPDVAARLGLGNPKAISTRGHAGRNPTERVMAWVRANEPSIARAGHKAIFDRAIELKRLARDGRVEWDEHGPR